MAMKDRRHVCVLLMCSALGAAGCGDEASVGTDDGDCYPGVKCETFDLNVGHGFVETPIASSETTDRLEPTWTHEVLGATDLRVETDPAMLGTLGGLGSPLPVLEIASGPGGVWAFVRSEQELEVFQVTPSGDILSQGGVKAPEGIDRPDDTEQAVASFCHAHGHEQGPALTLAWSARCQETDGACGQRETVVFAEDAAADVRRIRGDLSVPVCSATYGFRDAAGDGLLLHSFESWSARKVDLDGESLWQRLLPQSALHSDYMRLRTALSPSDTLVTSLARTDGVTDEYAATTGLTFLELGEEDAVFRQVGFAPGLSLTAARPIPMFDGQGRWILIFQLTTLDAGDLMVARYDPEAERSDMVWIQRESYVGLTAYANAVDNEGNVYLASMQGPRTAELQRPILCRVTSDFDDVHCFVIDELPRTMVATEPGVVFTASNAGLQRYDVPL